MSDDSSVFTDDQPTNSDTSTDQPQGVDKRLADKDNFIKQLQSENAEMRAAVKELETKSASELETLKQEMEALRNRANQPTTPAQSNTSVSEEDIKALVANAITERERSNTAAQNHNEANLAMINAHGSREKAREAMLTKAAELNMSEDALLQTAQTSPSAFKVLMGLTDAPKNSAQPVVDIGQGNVRPEVIEEGGFKRGTKAYWDNIRRTRGMAYYSQVRNQQQIMKDKLSGVYDS